MSRIKLQIPHPDQDVPTEIRGYGKACGGTMAIVLKPAQNRGLIALQIRGEPSKVWKATKANDAPELLATSMSDADAVAAMRDVRAVVAPLAPSTLKGTWSGSIECDASNVPRVELRRKIAAYGTIVLFSTPAGWRWTVERDPRWFADAKVMKATEGVPHLTGALGEAMDAMMGLVRTACGVRDTTRRESRDTDYAAQRQVKAAAATEKRTAKAAASGKPRKPAKPVADPTERLKPRKAIDRKAATAAASAAKVVARAEAKAQKAADKAATAAAGKAATVAKRVAAAAEKRAAKAAARVAKAPKPPKAPKVKATPAPKAAKVPKAAAAAEPKPAKAGKKPKLTDAEKDAALMALLVNAVKAAG